MIKIAFFDTKEYDKASFARYEKTGEIEFKFLETKLTEDTVDLAMTMEIVVKAGGYEVTLSHNAYVPVTQSFLNLRH